MVSETFNGHRFEALQACLEPLQKQYLDCDGKTQIVHTVLQQLAIRHSCWLGAAVCHATRSKIGPHWWVELNSDQGTLFRVDYSLHQWTKAAVPSGFFCPQQETNVSYDGYQVTVWTIPLEVFEFVQFDPRHREIVTLDSLQTLLSSH